ncbi:MAG TPA: ABC transporter permease [Vicinamibacterales bacterium]|nr:ABC transporter permease [Vicinamibacterales bacterium]
MFTDLRHAARLLLKAPGFTLLVVIVLALGIGATTSIFSVVNGVLLEPLPFPEAGRLIAIQSVTPGDDDGTAAVPDIADFQAARSVRDVVGYTGGTTILTGRGEATTLLTSFVTGDLMATLQALPLRGRSFSVADVRAGAAPTAVISERLWTERFGREPSATGGSATIDGQAFTIVGVMPDTFNFPIQAKPVDVWLPVATTQIGAQLAAQRGAHFMHTIARLRPEASAAQAAGELGAIAERLAREYPKSNAARTVHVLPLQERIVRQHRTALAVLLAAVAGVLLIVCANVANLLLARGVARRREIAIRAALGAGRARIVRQLLIESLLIAVVAGAAGMLLSQWGLSAIVAASPVDIPRLHGVRIDTTVLLFAAALSAATGIVFGIIPAFQVSRSDAGETLKGTTGGIDPRHARTRQVLVAAEVALSLLLLAAAGLLGRTLLNLERVDVGFAAERALAMEISLPDTRYPNAAAHIAFYRRTIEALQAIPGVRSAAASSTLPLTGNDMGIGFRIEGRPVRDEDHINAAYHAVSPDYFATMGIRVLRGRGLTDRDTEHAPPVLVISETMARVFWPGEDPVGKRVTIGYNNSGPREVVGIVSDVKESALAEPPRPQMYAAFPQTPWPFFTAVVRTERDPEPIASALRAAVMRLDPEQPPGDVRALTHYVREAAAQPRFTAVLAGTFAALATLLAGLGLYGVLAYSVALRRREIGIRMALGARARDVGSMVVGQALVLGGIGVAVGLAGALALTRMLRSLLFDVGASDPLTFALVSLMLMAVVAAAAYLPARRATRVDPLVALRAD